MGQLSLLLSSLSEITVNMLFNIIKADVNSLSNFVILDAMISIWRSLFPPSTKNGFCLLFDGSGALHILYMHDCVRPTQPRNVELFFKIKRNLSKWIGWNDLTQHIFLSNKMSDLSLVSRVNHLEMRRDSNMNRSRLRRKEKKRNKKWN